MNSELEYTIRLLQEDSDYAAFESLQRETWGADVEEVVTAALARIVQRIGGIAAGAFDKRNNMIGLVFGFTGVRDGKPIHWSHMLAVKNGHRNTGVGTQLKLYQKRTLLELGVEEVYWTYDPLVAKNARMNLNVLGAEVLEYVQDMYGSGEDSELFRGIGTDRFIVLWRIADEGVGKIIEKTIGFDHEPFLRSPLAVCRRTEIDPASFPVNKLDIRDKRLRVEIPPDVHQLMSTSIASAADWREKTRKAFLEYSQMDYRVVGIYFDNISGRCFYCLEKPG